MDLEAHRDLAAAARAQHGDDRRQLEQVAAVVDGLGLAVADRDERAGLIVARARRVQPEADRPVRDELEVALELDARAVVEARRREAHGEPRGLVPPPTSVVGTRRRTPLASTPM